MRCLCLVKVFAEYEPNMPRVAGRGKPEPDRKSISRSASAVSLTQGRAKVRWTERQSMCRQKHAHSTFIFLPL